MRNLSRVFIESPTELARAQADWDRFYKAAFAERTEPNPDQRHDHALDQTIRELGRRPRAPLTEQERNDEILQHEVAQLFSEVTRRPNIGQCFRRDDNET